MQDQRDAEEEKGKGPAGRTTQGSKAGARGFESKGPGQEPRRPATGSNRSKNTYKTMAKPKNFHMGLAIDTDAINELYTYGGEQGKRKSAEESEMEDFESGILELANQCLAAMGREKPTDPIIYENEETGSKNPKKSFE